jgi:hypothetical protein
MGLVCDRRPDVRRDDDRERGSARQRLRRRPGARPDQIGLLQQGRRASAEARADQGHDGEYIVSFEAYTFVIPADKALPSSDHCSHIFFENVWMTARGNQVRVPWTPNVYCFLTPLDF